MKLQDIQVQNEKETRGGFGEGIHEIGKENENVVVLTADLAGSLKLGPFIKDFPNRFVQVGIADSSVDSELTEKIAQSSGAQLVDGKLLLSGTTSVVIDICADGQQRFVRAVNSLSDEKITEKSLANAILHPASCEPDLVVIFGDPTQLPSSLVWELAYSELVYLNTQWPHCNIEDIELAINDFQRRDRRFGGVDS